MDYAEKKRQFLAIKTYAEFDRRRSEFKDFPNGRDREVCAHFTTLLKNEGVPFGTQEPDSTVHIDYYR